MILRSVLLLLIGLTVSPAAAHLQREAPWHPVAGAYRSAVFLLNLRPPDWSLIERMLVGPGGASGASSPLDRLHGTAPDQAEAVRQALDSQDADALFEALTRATAWTIRHHLAAAAGALDQPGRAALDVAAARDVYRAFADGIRQTDPARAQALGLAWLDLSSSIGHAGISGIGEKPADRAAFDAARATIETYVMANFAPEAFAPRRAYGPVPETVLRADPSARVAPWLPPGSDINDQDPLPRLVLNFEQRGIDERDLFLVAFGDMLFDSTEIMGEPARSLGLACSTCHNRSDINRRLFIPGITPKPGVIDVDGSFFNARFNDHRDDAVDIPSLRGIRFTAPYGRDGRFASLPDFTRNVIVNEFAGDEPSPLMLDALVAYMLEFDFLPAPFLDADGRLNETASDAARRGEALFNRPFAGMQGRSCASCHIPDSHFTDERPHAIGSGEPGYANALDAAYDTPTLLGIVHTAPYFHDGSIETLEEVVAWFDRRFELGLEERDREDLVAYLEAVGTGEDPYEAFDEENTPFRLMADELSTFLSTLDTLVPDREREPALLLLRTVRNDLAADASAMTNRAAISRARELVDRLGELERAIKADDWAAAELLWEDYQTLETTYAPELF
ncbi:MAG TPA: cytochrome c peroxidase [Geminicoccaceae bacterium]